MKHFPVCAAFYALVFLSFVVAAHADTVVFTPTTPNPNYTASAITNGYGSDAQVSVGYSQWATNYPNRYGTIPSGGTSTGDGVYAYVDSLYNTGPAGYNYYDDTLTMTFTAAPGYTVTLNSFDLADYDDYNEYNGGSSCVAYCDFATNISVTGGQSSYIVNGAYPSGDTYSIYSPGVTGQSLTLTVTNLYDIGINDIDYTVNAPAVAATPEPSSLVLLGTGILAAAGAARRRLSRFKDNRGPIVLHSHGAYPTHWAA